MEKKVLEHFMNNTCQKHQTESKVEKLIKKKGDK